MYTRSAVEVPCAVVLALPLRVHAALAVVAWRGGEVQLSPLAAGEDACRAWAKGGVRPVRPEASTASISSNAVCTMLCSSCECCLTRGTPPPKTCHSDDVVVARSFASRRGLEGTLHGVWGSSAPSSKSSSGGRKLACCESGAPSGVLGM
eukprot:CAMPEP_0118809740 /NCGR_PEP_ID=MMETSP1162-20130426/507_1 /TAXON_ID=33656 /ORGANISM="Phaeocystis Sp, Strain CCMP2710" /LENGTH=149 /DNA_ID=CAMNT_0006739203 /DNA_START=83 /DNA_END=533 /DNA_ORIENTATION=-